MKLTITVYGKTLTNAVICRICGARFWPATLLESHRSKHEMKPESFYAQVKMKGQRRTKYAGPLVGVLMFLWSTVASAQYIRDNCSALSLPATAKATCFDWNTKKLLYWGGSSFVIVNHAPNDATYITQTANATLTNEQALGALSTGLSKHTTTTGVVSTAVAGTDYVGPGAITTSGLTQATGKLLGRNTASTGAVEEITLGTNLSFSGTTLNSTAGAGGYATVQDEGSGLTARTTLNFTGAGVSCADDTTKTTCTIAGGSGGYDPVATYTEWDDFYIGYQGGGGSNGLKLGWQNGNFSGSGGSITPDTNHPGLFALNCGGNLTCRWFLNPFAGNISSNQTFHPDYTFETTLIFRPTSSNTTTGVDYRFGLFSDITANPPADGIYLEKLSSDSNWFCVTRASSTQTRTDAGVAFAADTFFKLRVRRVDGTTMGCKVDSASEVTQTTNIPANGSNLYVGFQTITPNDGLNHFNHMDLFVYSVTGLTR
jgi:hypothetical protein